MARSDEGFFQISLMNVFRRSAASRDARDDSVAYTEDAARILSSRSIERREGTDQAQLRDHLAQDLANLLSTVNLEAAVDLTEFDHVRKSVLNYGIPDLSRLTGSDLTGPVALRAMRDALIAHEPRLIPGTVEVRLRGDREDNHQRVAFDISAEMSAKPVDVPLEFVAEIDVGVGKAGVTQIKVRG